MVLVITYIGRSKDIQNIKLFYNFKLGHFGLIKATKNIFISGVRGIRKTQKLCDFKGSYIVYSFPWPKLFVGLNFPHLQTFRHF